MINANDSRELLERNLGIVDNRIDYHASNLPGKDVVYMKLFELFVRAIIYIGDCIRERK